MSPNQPSRRPLRPLDASQLRPQRRVFDVAPPGRMPAPATSRPVVPSQKPLVHDASMRPLTPSVNGIVPQRSMLNMQSRAPQQAMNGNGMQSQPGAAPSGAPATVQRLARPTTKPVIKPLSPSQAPLQPSTPVSPMSPRPPLSPAPPAAPAVPRTPVPRSTPQPPGSAISHDIDDMPPGVVEPVQINDDPVLISKHVPRDQTSMWRWIIMVTILVLIFLVICDVLLDADFITLRHVPHTHFF